MKREMVLLTWLICRPSATVAATPALPTVLLRQRAEMVEIAADKFKENRPPSADQRQTPSSRSSVVRERHLDDPGHRHRRQELRAFGRRRLGRPMHAMGSRNASRSPHTAGRSARRLARCGLGMEAEQRHQPLGLARRAFLVAVEDRADQRRHDARRLRPARCRPCSGTRSGGCGSAAARRAVRRTDCRRPRHRLVQRLVGFEERDDIAGRSPPSAWRARLVETVRPPRG